MVNQVTNSQNTNQLPIEKKDLKINLGVSELTFPTNNSSSTPEKHKNLNVEQTKELDNRVNTGLTRASTIEPVGKIFGDKPTSTQKHLNTPKLVQPEILVNSESLKRKVKNLPDSGYKSKLMEVIDRVAQMSITICGSLSDSLKASHLKLIANLDEALSGYNMEDISKNVARLIEESRPSTTKKSLDTKTMGFNTGTVESIIKNISTSPEMRITSFISDQCKQLLNSPNGLSEDDKKNIKEILGRNKGYTGMNTEDIAALKSIISKSSKDNPQLVQSINKLFSEIEYVRANGGKLSQELNSAMQKATETVSSLNAVFSAIKSSDHDGFTTVISGVMKDYENVLKSGNKVNIALYSVMADKLKAAMERKPPASGAELAKIVSDFQNLMKDLTDSTISTEKKDKLVMNYAGDNIGRLIIGDVAAQASVGGGGAGNSGSSVNGKGRTHTTAGTGANNQVAHEPSASGDPYSTAIAANPNKTTTPDGKPFSITGPDGKYKQSVSDQGLKQLSTMSSQDIQTSIKKHGLGDKLKDVFKANDKLIEVEHKIAIFFDHNNNILNSLKEKDKFSLDKVLRKAIDNAIKTCLNLESALNLEVDASAGSIVPLLEKFREIITTLDLDTKSNIRKTLEANNISNSFSSNKKDMKLRWESLDKLRKELNQVFEDIKSDRLKA